MATTHIPMPTIEPPDDTVRSEILNVRLTVGEMRELKERWRRELDGKPHRPFSWWVRQMLFGR